MEMSDVKGKKVKILSSYDNVILEEKINTFIDNCDRPIWNIQYSIAGAGNNYFEYSALIIYG